MISHRAPASNPITHQIRGEVHQLMFVLYELDRGPCTESVIERIADIGMKLCDLADEFYRTQLYQAPPPKKT